MANENTDKKEKNNKQKKESNDKFKDDKFFSIAKLAENTLENTRPNAKHDILEGVAFYSQNSINKEWETLRSPWYQNNIQFKTKFRKLSNRNLILDKSNPSQTQSQVYANYTNNPEMNQHMLRNLNDNKRLM